MLLVIIAYFIVLNIVLLPTLYLYKGFSKFHVDEFHDMDCTRESFSPSPLTYTHYGVVVDSVLASIAASYVTLPWIHVIGGVYTRERCRGRLC